MDLRRLPWLLALLVAEEDLGRRGEWWELREGTLLFEPRLPRSMKKDSWEAVSLLVFPDVMCLSSSVSGK